jgi:hypothetical protein
MEWLGMSWFVFHFVYNSYHDLRYLVYYIGIIMFLVYSRGPDMRYTGFT